MMNAIISPELLTLLHPCERTHCLSTPKEIKGSISFYVSHLLANNISLITKWIELNHSHLEDLNVQIRSRLDHDFHVNLAAKSLFADYSDFKNGYFNFILEKLYLKFPKLMITISLLQINESFLIGPLDDELGLTAGYLSLVLDQMGHKDEIFVLGQKSTYIAKTIISSSCQSSRRRSSSNIALILIDRDLDLKTVTRCNQGILDVLYNLVSDGYKTWMISDSDQMELKLEKYGLQNDVLELLNILTGMDLKTGLSVLRKKILDILSLDIPDTKNTKRVLGRVTKEQLKSFMAPLQDNWEVIEKRPQLYQFLAAFLDILDHSELLIYDNLAAFQSQMLHSYDQVLEEIKSLLSNGKELSIYQILLMLTFAASIGVDTCSLEPIVNSILSERGYKDFEIWLDNVFKTLEKLSPVHLDYYSSRSDVSLCKSISESVLHGKDADDLTHIPYSGTIGTVLSGLNSLLGGAPSHYKPSNYSRVFFFLVGGITWSEIHDLRSVTKGVSDSEVMIGSTNIITHRMLLNDLYGNLPIIKPISP